MTSTDKTKTRIVVAGTGTICEDLVVGSDCILVKGLPSDIEVPRGSILRLQNPLEKGLKHDEGQTAEMSKRRLIALTGVVVRSEDGILALQAMDLFAAEDELENESSKIHTLPTKGLEVKLLVKEFNKPDKTKGRFVLCMQNDDDHYWYMTKLTRNADHDEDHYEYSYEVGTVQDALVFPSREVADALGKRLMEEEYDEHCKYFIEDLDNIFSGANRYDDAECERILSRSREMRKNVFQVNVEKQHD